MKSVAPDPEALAPFLGQAVGAGPGGHRAVKARLHDRNQGQVGALAAELFNSLDVDPVVQGRDGLVLAQRSEQALIDPERAAEVRAGMHGLEADGVDLPRVTQHSVYGRAIAGRVAAGAADALQPARGKLSLGGEVQQLVLERRRT